ncbi:MULTISPECIES: DUF937 domain-containing protein [unclassified Lysobacter]
MTTLTNDLLQQLQGQPMSQLSQKLGLDTEQTASAVSAALPLLMGALGRNASQPQGAQQLLGALQRDHGGLDLGSVLGSVMGGGGNGGDILGHVLGGRQQTAAQGLGAVTGLDGDRAGSLLKMLAPLVMAFLAKQMGSGGNAAATPQALEGLLGQEQAQIREQGGIGGGLLGAVLDQDGDGQAGLSDLLKIGGSLFGGKR